MAKITTLIKNGEKLYPRTKIDAVDGLSSELSRLSENATTVAGQIITVTNSVVANKTNISGLQSRMDTAETNYSALAERVTTNERNITNNNEAIENIQSEVTNNKNSIGNNSAAISANQSAIQEINKKISAQASETNQLADKEFVNSSINALAASYVTNENNSAFATKEEFDNAITNKQLFINGVIAEPTNNDYAIVLSDESQERGADGSYPTVRYHFGKTGDEAGVWALQYIVNKTALTAAQLAAVNSGITAESVAQINTNKDEIAALKSASEQGVAGLNDKVTKLQGDFNSYKETNDAAVAANTTLINSYKESNDAALAAVKSTADNAAADLTALKGTAESVFSDTAPTVFGNAKQTKANKEAIESANTEIANAKSDITALTGRVSTNETEITGIKEATTNLETRVEANETTLASLSTNYQKKLKPGSNVTIDEKTNTINVIVDATLNEESAHAVQNSVITAELAKKVECIDSVDTSELTGTDPNTSTRLQGLENKIAELSVAIAKLSGSVSTSVYYNINIVEKSSMETIETKKIEGKKGPNLLEVALPSGYIFNSLHHAPDGVKLSANNQTSVKLDINTQETITFTILVDAQAVEETYSINIQYQEGGKELETATYSVPVSQTSFSTSILDGYEFSKLLSHQNCEVSVENNIINLTGISGNCNIVIEVIRKISEERNVTIDFLDAKGENVGSQIIRLDPSFSDYDILLSIPEGYSYNNLGTISNAQGSFDGKQLSLTNITGNVTVIVNVIALESQVKSAPTVEFNPDSGVLSYTTVENANIYKLYVDGNSIMNI